MKVRIKHGNLELEIETTDDITYFSQVKELVGFAVAEFTKLTEAVKK